MVKRGTPLPDKLKSDSIVEAILELRFRSLPVPEVFYGRMVDHRLWEGFELRKLPAHELPALFRTDPNIRFLPVMELVGLDRSALRIGPHSLSFHHLAPYSGWKAFEPRLGQVVDSLFDTAREISIERVGLRYLNVLNSSQHRIGSFADLDLQLSDADGPICSNLNINFVRKVSESSSCAVRLATPEFMQEPLPPGSAVVVDIDVFTDTGFVTGDRVVVKKWIEDAHGFEKSAFFQLLTPSAIQNLTENK